MRIEDIGKKISHLWMIFSGMSVERLRRYVGEEGRVREWCKGKRRGRASR